jgi:hypothetical protein
MCELANRAIRNPDETNQRTSLPPSACCGRASDPFSASSTLTSTFGASETPRFEGALMPKSRMSSNRHLERQRGSVLLDGDPGAFAFDAESALGDGRVGWFTGPRWIARPTHRG